VKLLVEITLGNEAMHTPQDIAAKLDQLADLFNGFGEVLHPGERPIRDRNGNTVGRWAVTADP
jgi:hypothetical protein